MIGKVLLDIISTRLFLFLTIVLTFSLCKTRTKENELVNSKKISSYKDLFDHTQYPEKKLLILNLDTVSSLKELGIYIRKHYNVNCEGHIPIPVGLTYSIDEDSFILGGKSIDTYIICSFKHPCGTDSLPIQPVGLNSSFMESFIVDSTGKFFDAMRPLNIKEYELHSLAFRNISNFAGSGKKIYSIHMVDMISPNILKKVLDKTIYYYTNNLNSFCETSFFKSIGEMDSTEIENLIDRVGIEIRVDLLPINTTIIPLPTDRQELK